MPLKLNTKHAEPMPPSLPLSSGDLYNNTPIFTAMGVTVTPFNDPCMLEGSIALHDSCVDKPTPDSFTCEEQKFFNKCYFPL